MGHRHELKQAVHAGLQEVLVQVLSSAREEEVELHPMALGEPGARLFSLELEVVITCTQFNLDGFDLHHMGLRFSHLSLLSLLVLILTKVGNLSYRRHRVRGDLNKVESGLCGKFKSLLESDDTMVLAFRPDNTKLSGADLMISTGSDNSQFSFLLRLIYHSRDEITMSTLALGTAFLGGLVSFLSPCVLPIIPGFLAFLAGSGTGKEATRRDVFLSSVYFVLGFATVFALLGVLLNTVLAHVAYAASLWLSRVGGIIVIFFGLYLTGLINPGFLTREHKLRVNTRIASRPLLSFLFGLAFAAGWTPCVGPVLGVIIGLSVSAPGSAFVLFLSYALGLGLPFLLVGGFAAQAAALISRYERAAAIVSKVFGVILVILGILVFTQTLSAVADFGIVNSIISK